jgi:hypothetical protein
MANPDGVRGVDRLAAVDKVQGPVGARWTQGTGRSSEGLHRNLKSSYFALQVAVVKQTRGCRYRLE